MSLKKTVANSVSTLLNRYSPERLFLLPYRLENAYPPVFIIGTPRSGTTVVYQHLVNRFRFSYFSNFSRKFSPLVIPSAVLGRALLSYAPATDSSFGVTKGAMGPSDGWSIFYRWFPREGTRADGNVRGLHELKNIVRIHERLFGAPFINKNNANTLRIRELARLFPDALFVHIHRSPVQAAFSLLDARKHHGTGVNEWWGPTPPDLVGCQFPSEEAQVVRQVVGLERLIQDNLRSIPVSQKISVSYESFCGNPAELCARVAAFYDARNCTLLSRSCDLPDHYKVSSKASLYDETVMDSIEHELELAGSVERSLLADQAAGS